MLPLSYCKSSVVSTFTAAVRYNNECFYFIFPGGAKNVSSRGKTNLAFVEDTDEDDGHNGHGGHEDDVQSSVLPWKRNNTDSEMNKPMKQSEFPSWINNKEYTQNYSPYNTVNQGKL